MIMDGKKKPKKDGSEEKKPEDPSAPAEQHWDGSGDRSLVTFIIATALHAPMETYLVEKTDDSKGVTIGFKDVNVTLLAPLMKALDDDENVVMVRFIETHPELDDRKLRVEVRSGSALEAIANAAQAASDYFSDCKVVPAERSR